MQGSPVDLGGYYRPDDAKASAVMTPSATLNQVLAGLRQARGTTPLNPRRA